MLGLYGDGILCLCVNAARTIEMQTHNCQNIYDITWIHDRSKFKTLNYNNTITLFKSIYAFIFSFMHNVSCWNIKWKRRQRRNRNARTINADVLFFFCDIIRCMLLHYEWLSFTYAVIRIIRTQKLHNAFIIALNMFENPSIFECASIWIRTIIFFENRNFIANNFCI